MLQDNNEVEHKYIFLISLKFNEFYIYSSASIKILKYSVNEQKRET